MMNWQLVISCEHASNQVPQDYANLFLDAGEDLKSHRGWDPGSLEVAAMLAEAFKVKPFVYPYSRLLIEPNRSVEHPQLFSEYSKILPPKEKTYIIDQYYLPHRDAVEHEVRKLAKQGTVLHLGIHTFTPFWKGKKREVDIGILFDPDLRMELNFSEQLIQTLKQNAGVLYVKANEPYQGVDDGLTTYLRTRFRDEEYLGIEIEISQQFTDKLPAMGNLLVRSVTEALQLT